MTKKYGATADVDAMLKGSTEVVGGGGMADYRERTDKEYADYRKIMNTKMDIEDPSALAQDIGASPIDRYLQGDKIPAPIKQYEEEFKAHEFDLSKPLEAVETQSQHIPDMTQKEIMDQMIGVLILINMVFHKTITIMLIKLDGGLQNFRN